MEQRHLGLALLFLKGWRTGKNSGLEKRHLDICNWGGLNLCLLEMPALRPHCGQACCLLGTPVHKVYKASLRAWPISLRGFVGDWETSTPLPMPLLAFVPDPETSVTPGPEGTRGISEELAFPQQETKYTETQALPSLNPQGESVNSPNAGAHHVLSGNGGGRCTRKQQPLSSLGQDPSLPTVSLRHGTYPCQVQRD